MEKRMVILGIIITLILVCIFLATTNIIKVNEIPVVNNIGRILGITGGSSQLLNPRFKIFYQGVEVAGIDHAGNMNMSGNLSIKEKICNITSGCPAYIYHNGTGWIIKG